MEVFFMSCNYRDYDEMACGYICTNPKNKIKELHEKICYNQDKCMVNYQNEPLRLVFEILDNQININENRRKDSMIADVSYLALNNFKYNLKSALQCNGVDYP